MTDFLNDIPTQPGAKYALDMNRKNQTMLSNLVSSLPLWGKLMILYIVLTFVSGVIDEISLIIRLIKYLI